MLRTLTVIAMMVVWGAAPPTYGADAGNPILKLELNRIEAVDSGCRLHFVAWNEGDFDFESVQPELAFFDTDGVLMLRRGIDLGSLRPRKTRIMSFGIGDLDCRRVSRVILNGLIQCEHGGPVALDCLDAITLGHRGSVPFEK